MKKIVLGAFLLLCASFAANAATPTEFTIETSCGSSYSGSCDGCSVQDIVDVALALDDLDCG
ncbi:hypothetical protein [Pedobacter cryoconitis]|uniref:Uncharacterized protein n=1 Tax=Pedobacter cryoconitis TaxID=188932 RepID=A0A327SMC2_9SPHI|nr:hypothetical protein [Pedobacter cryoconitis]RAJ29565.1 hypothetical protein LY11_02828 [Pedobacter cryoconitis]